MVRTVYGGLKRATSVTHSLAITASNTNTQSLNISAKGVQCSGAQRISRREASELRLTTMARRAAKRYSLRLGIFLAERA